MTSRIPESYVANISIMFTEVPLLDRPAAAAAAGFGNIEAWWPFAGFAPEDAEIAALIAAVEAAGVRLCGLNFYAGNMAGGERGVACRAGRRQELEASFDALETIARATGCRMFNLLYGQIDPAVDEASQHAAAVDAIRSAAARVAVFGGTVLIEPLAQGLNGAYPLLTGDDVVALLDGPLRDVENVALLFDVFHLGSNGVDIIADADRLRRYIGHVQLADAPGRGEPGSGKLPIGAAVAALGKAGYSGYIACEYRPTGLTQDSLGWIPLAQTDRSTTQQEGGRT